MKKIVSIILILVLASVGLSFTSYPEINLRTIQPAKTLVGTLGDRFWDIDLAISNLESGSNLGTGNVFYVDSATGSATYDGKDKTHAKATLDSAIALCTANNGDIIYVMQGHAENWDTTDSADLDVAGITIIGLGDGNDTMPTFTFTDTDGELVIGAVNITIKNLAFTPSITGVVHAVEIEADADGAVIENCWFQNGETSGTDEFTDAIQPATGADDVIVVGCKFESFGGAGANTGIDLTAGVVSNWKIVGNYFNGDYAEAPIYSDNDVHLRMLISGNICQNTNSGDYGIELGGAATGVLQYNSVYTDALATCIDPGSMSCIENYGINTVDLSAVKVPVEPAISAQTVTAGSAADILAKLYYTSDGTGAYPATLANDSLLAMIMAKGATATPSTYNNTTDSLEAISDLVTTADTAIDTGYAIQEKCISKTITTIANGANNLFAVTGGPIKILDIVTYVTTTNIASEGCLIGYNIDPTTPATDTAFGTDGTAYEANGAVVGSALVWDGVLAADLTKEANGAFVGMGRDVADGLIVPIGMIELTAAHDGTCAGELTVYMRYIPLSPVSVVTAQ
jgi:hypothetical protein